MKSLLILITRDNTFGYSLPCLAPALDAVASGGRGSAPANMENGNCAEQSCIQLVTIPVKSFWSQSVEHPDICKRTVCPDNRSGAVIRTAAVGASHPGSTIGAAALQVRGRRVSAGNRHGAFQEDIHDRDGSPGILTGAAHPDIRNLGGFSECPYLAQGDG